MTDGHNIFIFKTFRSEQSACAHPSIATAKQHTLTSSNFHNLSPVTTTATQLLAPGHEEGMAPGHEEGKANLYVKIRGKGLL